MGSLVHNYEFLRKSVRRRRSFPTTTDSSNMNWIRTQLPEASLSMVQSIAHWWVLWVEVNWYTDSRNVLMAWWENKIVTTLCCDRQNHHFMYWDLICMTWWGVLLLQPHGPKTHVGLWPFLLLFYFETYDSDLGQFVHNWDMCKGAALGEGLFCCWLGRGMLLLMSFMRSKSLICIEKSARCEFFTSGHLPPKKMHCFWKEKSKVCNWHCAQGLLVEAFVDTKGQHATPSFWILSLVANCSLYRLEL